jgi:protein gp37
MSRRWWDKTTSPVPGCTPTSPGCKHCWAKATAENRLRGRYGYDEDEPFKVKPRPERLAEPLRVRKPTRWFYNSMGDLFHEDVPDEFIAACFGVMAACPQHTFQVLTKRAERMAQWFESLCMEHRGDIGGITIRVMDRVLPESTHYYIPVRGRDWPLPNVWLGVTAEDQQRADERIPLLLQTPAAVRFVSVEPMLSRVELISLPCNVSRLDGECSFDDYFCALTGAGHGDAQFDEYGPADEYPSLDWIICGAETGPGARPMDLAWARSLRDQCQAAGVPFFFKGAGPGVPIPEDLDIRQFPEVTNA